jgi:hypothetical protein
LDKKNLLPKRVIHYIHDVGVRSLDHLAQGLAAPLPAEGEEPKSASAVQKLVESWKAMSDEEKRGFVDKVATSVVEIVAASAVLPLGLKLGKKAAKATRKVIKKQTKKIKKAAKVASKPKAKPKAKAKSEKKS